MHRARGGGGRPHCYPQRCGCPARQATFSRLPRDRAEPVADRVVTLSGAGAPLVRRPLVACLATRSRFDLLQPFQKGLQPLGGEGSGDEVGWSMMRRCRGAVVLMPSITRVSKARRMRAMASGRLAP